MGGLAARRRAIRHTRLTLPGHPSPHRRSPLRLLALLLVCAGCGPGAEIRVYPAARIHTLEPGDAPAEAIALEGDRILAVGTLDEVKGALRDRAYRVDDRFRNHVILPGFVDPHLHPLLGAAILASEIVSAVSWQTPAGRTTPVRGREAFLSRLRQLARSGSGWLLVWGYHRPYHGPLSRADLDALSPDRPVLVWHRSAHEIHLNTAALHEAGLRREELAAHPHADWERGHLWESGLLELASPVVRRLMGPGRLLRGLTALARVVHRGGITTVGDQGFPLATALGELAVLHLDRLRTRPPWRLFLVPNAMTLLRREGSPEQAERAATRLLRLGFGDVRFLRHAKSFADGAIFSQLMQMTEPYLDGHAGAWMLEPERQGELLETFWRRGWDLHVHVNGDAGVDLVMDEIESLQGRAPDPHRRVVLEHYGFARADQALRAARLGLSISNNPYYVYELAPVYAEEGLGPDRARRISPLGELARAGVPFSLHSDHPMAPAEPLRLAEVAVTRRALDGRVWGPEHRISRELALRAITLEAARSLGLEEEIGSLRPGKRADLTVLERDPFEVPAEEMGDIPVWGTVVGGELHPIAPP